MRTQIAGMISAGTVLVALSAGPVAAAPPTALTKYDAGADTAALVLDAPVFDSEQADFTISAAQTVATVSSTPADAANGQALVTPVFETDEAPSQTPGGQPSNHVCAAEEELDLPSPLDLADPDLACIDTTAVVDTGTPAATSDASELVLALGGAGLTEQVLTPLLEPVLTPILAGLGELNPLINVDFVVGLIVDSLVDPEGTLARVTVAPNESDAGASAEAGVVAHALSRGVVIELLPDLPSGALVTITVGQSEARVVRNATTGEATPTVTPAVLDTQWNTIDVPTIVLLPGTPGEQALPVLTQQIEDALNDAIQQLATQSPFTCSGDNPLADVVCFTAASGEILDAAGAAAEGYDFGAGTVGARANALHLELLAAAEGGITLDLARAVAAANAAPVQAPTTTAPTPTTTQLARTGGSTSAGGWFAVILAAGLGGVVLVRRAASLR